MSAVGVTVEKLEITPLQVSEAVSAVMLGLNSTVIADLLNDPKLGGHLAIDPHCAGIATWIAYSDLTMEVLDTNPFLEDWAYWGYVEPADVDPLDIRAKKVERLLPLGRLLAEHIRKTDSVDVQTLRESILSVSSLAKAKPRRQPQELEDGEVAAGYFCEQCLAVREESDVDESKHLYECAECGCFVSDSNRCEVCNRFSRRISDIGCESCQEGDLVSARIVFQDGEWVLHDELEEQP